MVSGFDSKAWPVLGPVFALLAGTCFGESCAMAAIPIVRAYGGHDHRQPPDLLFVLGWLHTYNWKQQDYWKVPSFAAPG